LINSRSIFHVRFSVSKALPPLENRSLSHCIVSVGFRVVDRSRLILHWKNGTFPL
jgi:hypothetical protein